MFHPIELDSNYARSEITGSPGVWGIIESPSVPAQYRSIYTINSNGAAKGDIFNVHERSFNMDKIIILCRQLQC